MTAARQRGRRGSAAQSPGVSGSRRSAAVRPVSSLTVIGADFDGTLTDDSASPLAESLAPQLVKVVSLGARIAVISGNSVERIVPRLIEPVVSELCRQRALPLISQFHFAFAGGAVLAHVSRDDVAALLRHAHDDDQPGHVLEWLYPLDSAGRRALRPQIVSSEHVDRCRLEPDPRRRTSTEATVERILSDVAELFFAAFLRHSDLRSTYDLTLLTDADGRLTAPRVEIRQIQHAKDATPAVMQMTLRPLPTNGMRARGAELTVPDLRTQAAAEIQRRLDDAGLGHLAARPAGRSSIDVAPRTIDKAVAMRTVLGLLDADAAACCYIGDEVFPGSNHLGTNDLALTTVPGLTVFAVGPCDEAPPAPPLARIVTPPPTLSGPRASAHVLQTFIDVAERETERVGAAASDRAPRSAIALVLERLLSPTRRGENDTNAQWRRARPRSPAPRRAHVGPRIEPSPQAARPAQSRAARPALAWVAILAAPARAPPSEIRP